MSEQIAVFLSSTYEDLKNHRKILIESLHRLRARVEGMEFFGASWDTPLEESLKRVRSSDVYVGILGTRYGSIDEATGRSITELEYFEAKNLKMPILMYIIDKDRHPVLATYVETGDSAKALAKFIESVKRDHLVEYFSSPENLCRKVIYVFTGTSCG